MDFIETGWKEPDDGIWEVRGPRRHFTHSKVMAWVAVDRAVRDVEEFGIEGPVDRWKPLRYDIHARGVRQGLRPRAQHLHPVLRLERARRERAHDPHRRLPAAGGPPGRRHRGGDRDASSRSTGSCSATTPTDSTARRRPRGPRGGLPGVLVLAGGRPPPDRPRGRGRASCSSACCRCATTSACSPRSTTRSRSARSGTSLRPSATSRS